jgi:hypothetical protein
MHWRFDQREGCVGPLVLHCLHGRGNRVRWWLCWWMLFWMETRRSGCWRGIYTVPEARSGVHPQLEGIVGVVSHSALLAVPIQLKATSHERLVVNPLACFSCEWDGPPTVPGGSERRGYNERCTVSCDQWCGALAFPSGTCMYLSPMLLNKGETICPDSVDWTPWTPTLRRFRPHRPDQVVLVRRAPAIY